MENKLDGGAVIDRLNEAGESTAITERKEGLVTIAEGCELGELIKPLMREIHLFDTFVAGTSHLNEKTVLGEIKVGNRLTLLRENNKFDSNAIVVMTPDKRKVGYIPEKDNIIFSRLMDAGKLLEARVNDIELKEKFTQIRIGIYLVDF